MIQALRVSIGLQDFKRIRQKNTWVFGLQGFKSAQGSQGFDGRMRDEAPP